MVYVVPGVPVFPVLDIVVGIALFEAIRQDLEEKGITIPKKHCANSATIMELPQYAMDAVRAGITLYGLLPSDEVDPARLALRPVMALTSHVSHVKVLTEGRMISYGGSNYNISFLIREADKQRALQSLSDTLFNK